MVQELLGQEAILDCVAAGIIAFRNDTILYANAAAEVLTGFTRHDLEHIPLSNLISPDSRPALLTVYDSAPPHQLELQVHMASEVRWIELHTKPVLVDGAPALLATLTDISGHKQEIEAVRYSEGQFRALVELNPDVIVRRDMEYRYLYVSPTLRNYTGRTMDEMFGKTMEDMKLPPGEIQRVTAAIDQAATSRQTVALETYLPRPDHLIHFDTRIVPEFDERGNVISTVLYSRDITRRKHAEEALKISEQRLRSILDHMPVMLDAFDDDFNALFWNRECERVTGYTADEILGRNDVFRMLYSAEEYRTMSEYYDQHGDNFREKEWTLTRKDGTLRTISWSNITRQIPIPGWKRWAIGVDVTERRRLEGLLLEQERLQLVLDKELENAELRRRMMETVHHEFRTPLAVIQTSASMIERYLDRLTPEKRQSYLVSIRHQIGHLTWLLETISTIMSFQYGTFVMERETFDMREVCGRAIETIKERDDRGHRFELETVGSNFKISADAGVLQRACEHIILNAVKYSPANTSVRVILHDSGDTLRLEVIDQGQGIDTGEHKHIFEPFYRGSSIGYGAGGMGLGLALVKAVVDHHRGTVAVHSTPEQGTTVTLRLPRAVSR